MNHLHINSNKKWKYRFFILITGQSISVIGSTAVQFSVIWWLSTLTASPMVLAYAGLAAYVPQILTIIFVSYCRRNGMSLSMKCFTPGF